MGKGAKFLTTIAALSVIAACSPEQRQNVHDMDSAVKACQEDPVIRAGFIEVLQQVNNGVIAGPDDERELDRLLMDAEMQAVVPTDGAVDNSIKACLMGLRSIQNFVLELKFLRAQIDTMRTDAGKLYQEMDRFGREASHLKEFVPYIDGAIRLPWFYKEMFLFSAHYTQLVYDAEFRSVMARNDPDETPGGTRQGILRNLETIKDLRELLPR